MYCKLYCLYTHIKRHNLHTKQNKNHHDEDFFIFSSAQSFWLPLEHSTRSLSNAVSLMWLGKDLKEYIQCLTNIATAIADLHSYGLVLCDFSPYTIYIEKDLTASVQMTKVS